MKKLIISSVLVFLLCGIVAAQNKRPIAAVKEVSGIVKIRPASTKKSQSATTGTLLYDGDRLITEKFSMAAILFIDGSMLKIRDLSDVTLKVTPVGENKLDTKIDLPLGKIWSKVTRRDTKFEIETPSSVASIKGTEFAVIVDEDATSTILVFKGEVEFGNEFGTVLVKKNRKSSARSEEAPLEPQKMSKEEKQSDENFEYRQSFKWNLEIEAPDYAQNAERPFLLSLKASDVKSGVVDTKCQSEIVISSASAGARFSLDAKTWSSELTTRLKNGFAEIYAKGSQEGEILINVSGSNCSPVKAEVEIEKTGAQKQEEIEKIRQLLAKAGIEGMDELTYRGSKIETGWDIEMIADKVIAGELEIEEFQIVEDESGDKRIIIKLKHSDNSGGVEN